MTQTYAIKQSSLTARLLVLLTVLGPYRERPYRERSLYDPCVKLTEMQKQKKYFVKIAERSV